MKATAADRMQLAQDVIDQLDAKRFIPKEENYFSLTASQKGKFLDGMKHDGAETLKALKKCEVCQIGALMVAAVERHDALPINKLFIGATMNTDTVRSYLKKLFTKQQLSLMQSAFMQSAFTMPWQVPYTGRTTRAIDFGNRFKRTGERMRAIMQNVIDNKGTFKPEKIHAEI